MSDTAAVLSVASLEVRYGSATAVSGVSFQLSPGQVVAMLGPNGAGKSSVARACTGLVKAAGGSVELAGRNITAWGPDRIRRAGLVYLPETRGIFPNLTVSENLKIAVWLCRKPTEALDRAYELFPRLATRSSQRAGTLSGGEQQMLSLARLLAGEPSVVMVDEPSLGLAPLIVESVYESLRAAKEMGMTMVLIEQFAHRALELADSCVILRRGQVGWAGPASMASSVVLEQYLGEAAE